MQGVILAAGCGTRIRAHHDLPKGFLEVGDQPLILHSIEKLKKYGIKQIVIITGYRHAVYDAFAAQHSGVTTIYNPEFATFSSLYSLYCARHWVCDDILLLESDIFFEERAVEVLLKAIEPSAILVSGATHSGDEVYVETKANYLVAMSKAKDSLTIKNIVGEFVGINKLCLADYKKLVTLCDANHALLQQGYYEEQGLVALSRYSPLPCIKVDDLLWGEIDNREQLERVRALCSAISY